LVRIATLNLENLDDRGEAEAVFAERVKVLRPQLLRLEADILCLQEVNGQKDGTGKRALRALDRLCEGTPYAGFHRANTVQEATGSPADAQNLVILSRWPIRRFEQIAQTLVEGPRYRSVTAEPAESEARQIGWDRPVLHAEIAFEDGRVLHVIDVHLRAPLAAPVAGQKRGPFAWNTVGGWAEGFYIAVMKRAGQALETRLLVEQIFKADEDALIVVCGDVNAGIHEVPTRILCGDVEDTGNGLLAARMLIPIERSIPDSQRFSVFHHGRKLMLDHILVSRPLLAGFRHIEIHNEALGDELVSYASVEHAVETYHAPVVAEFDLALLARSPDDT